MKLISFKRKRKKLNRIEIAKNNTLKRIQAFRKHFSKKSKDDNFIQFFHIVRLFFAELFKIKYEFTLGELIIELNKRRIDKNLKEKTLFFLKKLSIIEYSDEKLPGLELKKLLSEFLKLFEKLTFSEQKVKETRLDKLLIFLRIKKPLIQKKEVRKKQDNLQPLILSKLKINFGKSKLEQVHALLIQALDMVNNNEIQKSRKLYIKIKKKYNQLNIEDKKEIYDNIILLYKELISTNKN